MGTEPPAFLSAAGHPVRWGLLSELAAGDRQVHELTELLGQPQNLVSYHLGKLRKADLVTARRSSADRRDTYYALNLARCSDLLADTGGALHPGLRMSPPAHPAEVSARVLFLCTGNSARSQMAEALLRRRTDGKVDARSAGSHPKPIHPHAVAAMAARGIDIAGARSKHLSEFAGERFDRVITLCDKVREVCPDFPGQAPVHWSMAEPSEKSEFFRTSEELDGRITFLLHTLKEAS
jgi:protein-tyrosine-phosphatase